MASSEATCAHCGIRFEPVPGSSATRCKACFEQAVLETAAVPGPSGRNPGRDVASSSQETGAVMPLSTVIDAGSGTRPAEGSELPRRIGRYEIASELGRGGMGVVFSAFDTTLRRPVAIKMVLDARWKGEEALKRFRLEASAAARLHHPGIVAVHEVGEHEGKPFLVMEMIEGESLDKVLARGGIAPRRLAEIIRGVALALEHAHENGIIHRDVKPENVIVDREGRTHLMDFGLAREVEAAERLTGTGQALGTPAFMSPEQANGDIEAQGPLSDVYGLGALLYWALAGGPPFEATSMRDLIKKILFEEPRPPRERRKLVPPDLETIALRCLAKEPARRYPSADAVAEELRRFEDGEPIVARPIGRAERTALWVRRNRALAAALLPVALIALSLPVAVPVGSYLVRENVRAEGEAAVRADRTRSLAALRAAADLASEEFAGSAVAEVASSEPVEARRERLDRRLALGLRALETAGRWAAAAPDDRDARRGAFLVACSLGDVAMESEQWSLAVAAFEEAGRRGVDDDVARRRLERVATERTRVANEHRKAVEAIVRSASSGALAATPGGHEDALFTLVGYREPGTVAILAEALDGVTAAIASATRDAYLSVAKPAPGEEGGELVGIEAALARRATLAPGEKVDSVSGALLRTCESRLEARLGRRDSGAARPVMRILADRQGASAGANALEVARLACEALGRIGIADGSVEPLGRYLREEQDEVRAAAAAGALCRLGGRRAAALVHAALGRFAVAGPFRERVLPHFRRLEALADVEASTPDELLERGAQRFVGGDVDGAIADFSRAIELAPADGNGWSNRGTARINKGDVQGGIADLTRALELMPGSAAVLSNRSAARQREGDIDGALADLTRAVELDPADATVLGNRGTLLYVKGRYDEAVAVLGSAIALSPDRSFFWRQRGTARFYQRDFRGAFGDLVRAVELDPRDAMALCIRGSIRGQLEDWDSASADFTRALELDPRLKDAWADRAQARVELGDFENAITDANRALAIDPRLVTALDARGCAKRGSHDLGGAISDLTRATELDPRSASSFYHRSLARADEGDREGAAADLARAIEIEPAYEGYAAEKAEAAKHPERREQPKSAAAWNTLGARAFRSADYSGAIFAFTRSLELDPQMAKTWSNRAEARRQRCDLDGALADATRAIELDPRMTSAWSNRGAVRYDRRDYQGSIDDCTRALAIEPTSGPALLNRGFARKAAGDRSGAIGDLERYLSTAPPNAPRQVVQAALDELRR
jgi:tetratricopeptide (TPR) repeat protein/predicted Ser/Thr protein kinase